MPKQYVAMRNAFKADGLSDKKARSKAAAIYNSKHKDHPVTNKEENIMTRLTREDIKALLEGDPRFTHMAPSGAGGRGDLFRGVSLSQQTRQAGEAQAKKEAPKRPRFTVHRLDAVGGRMVPSTKEIDKHDPDMFTGAVTGHVVDNTTGKIITRFKKHSSDTKTDYSSVEPPPYYKQLRESCSQYLNDEVVVKPENYDPSYGIAARKFLDSARVASANNMRRGAKIAGPVVSKVLPGGNALVKAGAELQAGIIEPKRLKVGKPAINSSVEDTPYFKQLKEAWWCGTCNSNEDTMTGDIGSVAVPFVAPGESEDERNKKRKKRRKLATIMAVSTGSIDGTGN